MTLGKRHTLVFRTDKIRALLVYLALEGKSHRREALAGMFWPELSDEAAATNLRTSLYRLRQPIDEALPGLTKQLFAINRQSVQLNPAHYTSDVLRFEDLLNTCAAHAHSGITQCEACLRRLSEAVEIYQDDLMIGFNLDDAPEFEDWLTLRRESVRQKLQAALHDLALAHEERDSDKAQAYARRLLRLEPWREDAHRLLMRVMARSGQSNLALAQYQVCRQVLAAELGIEPDAETVALYEKIRGGSAHPLATTSAISLVRKAGLSAMTSQHNLPNPLTSLIGRDRELNKVKQLLAEGRLVTLIGLGGTGKTRLSVEVAQALLEGFADGAWQIDLSTLAHPDLITRAVAETLGLHESLSQASEEMLVSYLRSKALLLLLDNCEHLLKPCRVLVQRILKACPRVQILVTSREALHLNGEVTYLLQPLAVPDPAKDILLKDLEALRRYDAVRLFVERVHTVNPDFRITPQNAKTIAQICWQLDGLPLALELAAARMRSLPLEEIAPRLNQRFALLSVDFQSGNPRHQTLRSVVDWGYDLLSEQEQQLFCQLAVFSSGFTLAAVEYVRGTHDVQSNVSTQPLGIDLLASLVDKSFVLLDRAEDGSGRYRLLETMRLYALERLAQSGTEPITRQRHWAFYTQLAEQATSYSRSPEMPQWFRRLDAEQDNLRSALAWAWEAKLEQGMAGVRLAGALGRYWEMRGHMVEGQHALDQILSLTKPIDPNQGGRQVAQQADPQLRQTMRWRGRALMALAFVPRASAETQKANDLLNEALLLFEALQDKFNVAQTYNLFGVILDDQSDFAQARHYYEKSNTLFRELGDNWGIALTLNNLASINNSLGRGLVALPMIEESILLIRRFGDPSRLANFLGTQAQTFQELGRFDQARQALAEAERIHRDMEDRARHAELLNDMADFESRQQRFSEARRLYLEGIAILQKIWDRRRLTICLEGLGRTLIALGDSMRAVRLMGHTNAQRAVLRLPMSPSQKTARAAALAAAEQMLGQVDYAKAWSAGHNMSFEQAIADAENVQSGHQAVVEIDSDHANSARPNFAGQRRYDWSEMPSVEVFHGRSTELVQLQGWLLQDQCRFVSILGLGGMGKTTLAAATVKAVAPAFEVIIWRSLLNAPTPSEMLRGCLQALSQHSLSVIPESQDARLRLLLDLLQAHRCLLVFDNLESLLQPSSADLQSVGAFRAGYEGYGQLFERLASGMHRSAVMLTSREQPNALIRIGRENTAVRQMQLGGLDLQAGIAILQGSGLAASARDTGFLVKQYSGNPLALQIVASTITDLFSGDVEVFQREGGFVFDGIRTILDQQFGRLSLLECELLTWLAIEREPVSAQELRENLVDSASMATFLGALGALQARSLLERNSEGLGLQNVVTEYATERMIDAICAEISAGPVLSNTSYLHRFAVLKAQAKDYIRQSQISLIVGSVIARLTAVLGKPALIKRLHDMLDHLRQHFRQRASYGAGNIVNLLLYLEADLENGDFSDLSVWQAYLRSAKLQNANFTNANLRGSVFVDTFASITDLAYSRDGRYIAGATSIGDIRIWLADTMQPIALLQGHSRLVMSLAFSSGDAHVLVSGAEDGTVRLWNIADSTLHGVVLYKAQGFVRAVAVSPKADWVAFAGDENDIQIWDMRTRRAVAVLHGHTNIITSLAFTPNGHYLASCSGDHTVRMWDVRQVYDVGAQSVSLIEQSNIAYEWPPEADDVWQMAISPDGNWLAGVNRDGMAWTWQIDEAMSSKPIRVLREKDVHHTTLAFSPDSAILAVGATRQVIWLLDVQTGQTVRQLEGHQQLTLTLAFAPNGQTLISSGSDRVLKVWELQLGRPIQAIAGSARTIRCVAYAPDGRAVVSCGADRVTRIWEMKEEMATEGQVRLIGECRHILQGGHSSGIWAVAIDSLSSVVASAGEDHTICLWDRRTGQLLRKLHGHHYTVTAIAFSSDRRTLVSGSPDQSVRLWDYHTGEQLAQLAANSPSRSVHEQSIWCVAVSPDGHSVAAGYSDGSIVIWDIQDPRNGRLVRELRRHLGWVRHIAFSPDGRLLASCSNDRTIRIWDVATGSMRNECIGHDDWVMWVAFHPDGETIASASFDSTVRLWRVADGQPIAPTDINPVMRHSKGVVSLAYHPNGHVLVSAGWEERLRFWDTHTQAALHHLIAPGPYSGMNITGVTGVSEAQRAALRALGAVD